MAKKKKTRTQEGPEAPVDSNVFPEVGAAQGAGQATTPDMIPSDVAELIRATLTVIVAQRRTYGLATTITSLTRAITKALPKYVNGIPTSALREFIKRELEGMGYRIVTAVVEYSGVKVESEVVLLYKDFEELVEMVKAGRLESLTPVITRDGPDPLYDKLVREAKKEAHA
jgi:septum formation topological specificity factor MinE